MTMVRRPKSSLSYAMASLAAAVAVSLLAPSIRGAEPAALTDGPLPLGTGKKGGEPCESGAECETGVCKDGSCHPCPDVENCPPPGTCMPREHEALDRAKDKACKQSGELSCSFVKLDEKDADCALLRSRRQLANECYESRVVEDDTCFLGGNKAHRGAQSDAKNVVDECDKRIGYKLERDICFDCANYKDLLEKAGSAWPKPDECVEEKNEAKVDCRKMEQHIANAMEIKSALRALESCFNGQLSKPRKDRFSKANEREGHCRDVLDFKRGKKLCR